jgi:GntR family transcriptional regulator
MYLLYTVGVNVVPRRLTIPPISAAAPGTLYQQIVDGLKREVSEGRLAPGAALPSFRGMAEGLLVSVITVKRAYEELEREGIIYRRQGLGTFVADAGHQKSRDAKRERARLLLAEALKEATEAGLETREVVELLRTLIPRKGSRTHASRP